MTVVPERIDDLLNGAKDAAGARLIRAMMAAKPTISRTTDDSGTPEGISIEFGDYILVGDANHMLTCYKSGKTIVVYYS